MHVTTEPLLAVALEFEDAHDYFDWLRGLSFVESGPTGLFLHDLAREALDADLRWRNPDRYAELHARVRSYYTRKLLEVRGAEQQRLLFDDVYLHRHNPMVKPFLEWGEYGSVFGERGTEADLNPIELLFAKLNIRLKQITAATLDTLGSTIHDTLEQIALGDLIGWFRHAGYVVYRCLYL